MSNNQQEKNAIWSKIAMSILAILLTLLIWIVTDTRTEVSCIRKDITDIKVALGKVETQLIERYSLK